MKPLICLLLDKDENIRLMTLESLSKIVIGNQSNVDMALESQMLTVLLPMIYQNVNQNSKIFKTAINVLLHLSTPNIDRKYLKQILDGLV